VFREAGADAKGNDILRALRKRERAEAWRLCWDGPSEGNGGSRPRACSQWLGLSALWLVVGYGIGLGYFKALLWVVAFTLVGVIVLWISAAAARQRGIGWCAWTSFDEILPVVELDKEHERFINEEVSGRWRWYFYVHRIAAYVLGSFIIAGLAGLTQGV
jgi:hypothetical protein